MSDRQYRSQSSRSASQDTTENLYDLGLLKRPKEPSLSSGTIRSYRSVTGETLHARSSQYRMDWLILSYPYNND